MNLKINGENWTICFCSPFDSALETSRGIYTIGVCDDNLKTIFIAKGLSRERMRKVLCHELTHAAMFSYNVVLDVQTEEIVADIMATYGEQIAGETERMFDYLTQ